ncbi:MAG: endonuclease [Bacteroidaceae bacterium]|nr:endonuclease [Bacteroidaceae bacterium]
MQSKKTDYTQYGTTIAHACIASFLFLFTSLSIKAQYFTLAEYNAENLFDTIAYTIPADSNFTPQGEHHWTRSRMFKKLRDTAAAIMAIDSVRPADIVCMEEVESDTILSYLTQLSPLRNLGYEYINTHSADSRGINVAILYSPLTFHLLNYHSIRPATDAPTRDILYASGLALNRDTIHILAVHLPSKLGGKKSNTNRNNVVRSILSVIDSIQTISPNANIIIAGDFNDGLKSRSIKQIKGFTDLMKNKKPGTYKYQGQWDTIDHILVSQSLLDSDNSLHTSSADAGIVDKPFLLEPDQQYGGTKPFRTFIGPRYNHGYSDHLPVYIRLTVKD